MHYKIVIVNATDADQSFEVENDSVEGLFNEFSYLSGFLAEDDLKGRHDIPIEFRVSYSEWREVFLNSVEDGVKLFLDFEAWHGEYSLTGTVLKE